MLSRTGRWLVAAIAALALAVGGAGVAFAGHHHHHRHHHGIPQHNGGDHDADNNAGPSDGDGLI